MKNKREYAFLIFWSVAILSVVFCHYRINAVSIKMKNENMQEFTIYYDCNKYIDRDTPTIETILRKLSLHEDVEESAAICLITIKEIKKSLPLTSKMPLSTPIEFTIDKVFEKNKFFSIAVGEKITALDETMWEEIAD